MKTFKEVSLANDELTLVIKECPGIDFPTLFEIVFDKLQMIHLMRVTGESFKFNGYEFYIVNSELNDMKPIVVLQPIKIKNTIVLY